ncbi:hypothetical protein [Klebsiella michiganensis]|uniref:hypothetical protein n=1 Tax=Klebsiella michiganensis TaxID=1134687 RepID=UPI001D0E776C|nr:hypothetical protein [Klebsiella michiganensis]
MTKLNVISAASKAQTRMVLTTAARITPMSDITELTQLMKAAAVRAKAATEDYVAHRMSITVYLEECKEFNDLSDGPDNILALVEALEKAQQRIFELESKLANPVQLPKTNGYWTETEKAYEEAITLAKRQIRVAGFRCEGDE